jgi:transcriptional regulator with XRE-family HTH domain
MTLIDTVATTAHPGDMIRARRVELGWTQAELAAATGVTQADISRIENRHLDARWSTIQRLSATLAEPQAAKRSLANGGTRNPPTASAKTWKPRRTALAIKR